MNTLQTVACVAAMAALVLSACTAAPAAAPAAPAAPASAGAAAEPGGCQEIPEGLEAIIPATEKPPLGAVDSYAVPVDQLIGFVFPDGTIALKAAALQAEEVAMESSPDLTTVGVVDVNEGSTTYEVSIDLETKTSPVKGQLTPPDGKETLDLEFAATPVKRNPEREGAAPAPVNVSITSLGVCYVVTTAGTSDYWQYCSIPDSGKGGEILSVSDTYSGRYAELMADMTSIAEKFVLTITPEFTISEMEDLANIQACADGGSCGADIAGAPVDFGRPFSGDEGEFAAQTKQAIALGCQSFPIDVGVVHVLRPIDSAGVQPGQYKVTYWFSLDKGFAGATISGTTDDNEPVENQSIPAIAATFVDGISVSQISAWRLFRHCVWWQSRCP